MVQRDHCFGGAAGRFHSDSSASNSHLIVLEEREFAALVLPLDATPIIDQPANFALEGGDDGEFRHSCWLETTRRRGAKHCRLGFSSIPVRARLCRNWPTFSSFPCELFPPWRAAPGRAGDRRESDPQHRPNKR